MKVLAAFVASLLIALVALAVLESVALATLFSPRFLARQARGTTVYQSLTDMLLAGLTEKIIDVKQKEAQKAVLSRVVTPDYIQSRVEDFAAQLDDRLHGGQSVPAVDLHDLGERALSAGLKVNTAGLPQSLLLGAKIDRQILTIYHLAVQVRFWLLAASTLIFFLLLAASIRVRHYRSLIYFFVMMTLIELGLFALFRFGPRAAIDQIVRLKTNLKPVVAIFDALIDKIAGAMAADFFYLALAFLVAGIFFFGLSRVSRAKIIMVLPKA